MMVWFYLLSLLLSLLLKKMSKRNYIALSHGQATHFFNLFIKDKKALG